MNMKLAEEHGQGMIQEELVGDNGGNIIKIHHMHV